MNGMPDSKIYLCIDLKSFYASVECVDRGLDPLTARLVVADASRGRTTICLAVTPALKELGVPSRGRLFQVPEHLGALIARPRMRRYMEVSASIYRIYLGYVSPQDIHIYSIDECFIDATPYLSLYRTDARSFAQLLMGEVLKRTGIRATAGIGPNLFLAKVALDVRAKHAADFIGILNEASFKEHLWFHQPLTDIWGIGPGIAARLARHGIHDLAGMAACAPAVLYREFGANAEFLIDHAWGQEPCTMEEIHAYEPERHSMMNGQVLPCDYTFEEARLVMHEMAEASVLELVEKGLATDSISLSVGYARAPRTDAALDGCAEAAPSPRRRSWQARTGGCRKIERLTNSRRTLLAAFDALFDDTTRRDTPIRRLALGFGGLVPERYAPVTLFDDVTADEEERSLQHAIVSVRERFGKNALLKAASLSEKATARERNNQVGGHHA